MDRAMAMQRRNVANCGVRRRKVLREKRRGSDPLLGSADEIRQGDQL